MVIDLLPDFLALMPCRHGLMLYPKGDKYIGQSLSIYGEFSEGEVDLFRQVIQPGSTIVEVGANLGAHTVALARIIGPAGAILAFEPQRIIYQILCANVALNGHQNVLTQQIGLGEKPGVLQVPPIDYRRDDNYGAYELGTQPGESVEIRRLDDFALSPSFIKIDVEGMEAAVLAGARTTIMQHRPVLYVENDRESSSPGLIELIQSFGYRLWWHIPPLYNPDNFRGHKPNIFGYTCSINMLCFPAENAPPVDLPEITSPSNNWHQLIASFNFPEH